MIRTHGSSPMPPNPIPDQVGERTGLPNVYDLLEGDVPEALEVTLDARYGPGGTLDLVDTAIGDARWVVDADRDTIYVELGGFAIRTGTPVFSATTDGRMGWRFDQTASEVVHGFTPWIPSSWLTFDVVVVGFNAIATTGGVARFVASRVTTAVAGADIAGTGTVTPAADITATTQYQRQDTTIGAGVARPASGRFKILLERAAAHANDTHAGDYVISWIELQRVT